MTAARATTLSAGKRRPGALTLIELLVVLGVIGLVVSMSVPALARYAGGARLTTATRQVVGLLSLARSLSVSSRTSHAVAVQADQRRIVLMNAATGEVLEQGAVRLPETMIADVQASGEPVVDGRITFRPTGALTGRSVVLTLSDRGKQQVITVTGPTGAVQVD